MTRPDLPQSKFKGRKGVLAGAAAAIMAAGLAGHEGVRLVAYSDPIGIPTICLGQTAGVKLGQVATLEQCQAWAGKDAMRAVEIVLDCNPNTDFTPHQLAAYADIAYNVGPRPVCDLQSSTMARLLHANKAAEACREFPKWDKARLAGRMVALPGLTKRRAHNMQTCMRGEA
jgi:GH24 family phage-related lysozyme (muramidase)